MGVVIFQNKNLISRFREMAAWKQKRGCKFILLGFFLFNRIILFVADQIKQQCNSVADFHFISKPIKAIGAVMPIYL